MATNPRAMRSYAPDGVYPEGFGYWAYGTWYEVLMIESLRSALGGSAGLERAEGFLASADFMNFMVAPSGVCYNYSDSPAVDVVNPLLYWFAAETGKKVRRSNQSFFNSDYPWAIANIDREIIGEDAGLEIKTTSELNMKKFGGGEYPANYYCQCVHYLAMTGKQRWYLAVLIGNRDFRWFTIERDEAEIAALMAAEADFWEMVKNNTPPVADGSQATTAAIKTIYAESNEDTVDLTLENTALAQYIALGKQIAELEAMRDEAANKIKSFMGDAGGGECDGFRVSWKSSTRRTFDSKRFAKENPGLDLAGYYKETSTRTFRVTELKGE